MAQQLHAVGKKVLAIDKRPNIAGNVYTENVEGIQVHKYGAHIFHTNDKKVWDYLQAFTVFNRFTNSPVANYKGELYSLPFNMYTFNKMWGVVTPEEAAAKIAEQRKEITGVPRNLEEQAISLVGRDIFEKLIKGYTEKQWGRDCKDLSAFIIRRLPVRYTFDNNYFNALYQGIPIGGYTKMVARMLEGVEVRLNEDYFAEEEETEKQLFEDYYKEKLDLSDDKELSFRDLAVNVRNDGIDTVVVKRGSIGAYAINKKDEEVKIPAFECDAVDTTAAGDSFNAGFLYSYLKGYDLAKSCTIANWVASKSVQAIGISGLPTLEELEEFTQSL